MNNTKTICTRLKISPDGMQANAGRPCTRFATQMRSDGRAFCSRCTKTEMNRLGADAYRWVAIQPEPKMNPIAKRTASQIISDHLEMGAIQSKITQLKGAKITEDNAIPYLLEYAKVFRYTVSLATSRKLDHRYKKALKIVLAMESKAREYRDAVRQERLAEMQNGGEA